MCVQEEKIDKTEEFLMATRFRPSTMRLKLAVESAAVALVDDRYGHSIKVLAARLQVQRLPDLACGACGRCKHACLA